MSSTPPIHNQSPSSAFTIYKQNSAERVRATANAVRQAAQVELGRSQIQSSTRPMTARGARGPLLIPLGRATTASPVTAASPSPTSDLRTTPMSILGILKTVPEQKTLRIQSEPIPPERATSATPEEKTVIVQRPQTAPPVLRKTRDAATPPPSLLRELELDNLEIGESAAKPTFVSTSITIRDKK